MRKLPLLAMALLLFLETTWARPLPNWPYEKLFAEADLVVIAELLATQATADVLDHPGHKRADYQGVNAEFQVRHLLKGAPKLPIFKVLHFRYGDTISEVNGALFARFRLKERVFSGEIRSKEGEAPIKVSQAEGKPDFLLFLKLRPDGRYEPVSGQYDAALSFREISTVENNH